MLVSTAQSRSITEPVKDTHAETIELRKKLDNYQKDKLATQRLQKRYDALRKQLDNLKLELDAKVLHCDKITEERDELKQKFEEAILNVQQKSSMSNNFFASINPTFRTKNFSIFRRPQKCFARAEVELPREGNGTAGIAAGRSSENLQHRTDCNVNANREAFGAEEREDWRFAIRAGPTVEGTRRHAGGVQSEDD